MTDEKLKQANVLSTEIDIVNCLLKKWCEKKILSKKSKWEFIPLDEEMSVSFELIESLIDCLRERKEKLESSFRTL